MNCIKNIVENSQGTFVFIHGFGGNCSYNNLFLEGDQQFNYYAITLPGHGDDENWQKEDLTIDSFADFVIDFIHKEKIEKFCLIGHSMGAAVAAKVANKIPHNVESLILANPMNIMVLFSIINAIRLCNNKTSSKKTIDNNELPKDVAAFKEMLKDNYQKNEKYLRQISKHIKNPFTHFVNEREYKRINHKTLVVFGENDKIINPKLSVLWLQKRLKNVQFEIIKDSGHAPMIEAPNDFRQIVINFYQSSINKSL